MERLWTVSDLLSWVTGYFKDKKIEEPRLEAEVLLAYCLQITRIGLYTNFDRPVTSEERESLKLLLKRRIAGEPIAYLTGQKEFMSLSFKVSPAVLIPRPETEVLVERAIEIVQNQGFSQVIDVGTGSGAIALSLAHYLPELLIRGVDISPEAVAIAQTNAEELGLAGRVNLSVGDLLTEQSEPFDMVVANLPYVPTSIQAQIPATVRDYEPGLALWAGEDGFDVYRRLIPQAFAKLKLGGCLLLEIDPLQQTLAKELLADYNRVEFIKDLAGRTRVVEAWKEWENDH